MKSVMSKVLAVLMVGALTGVVALAKTHKAKATFDSDIKVNGTLVKKGSYDVKFDDETNQLSIIKNGKNIPQSGRYVTFLTGFGGEEEYASLYLMPPKGGGRPHNPISRKLLDSSAWKPVMDQYPGYDQFMKTAFGDETKFILTPPKLPIAAFLDSRYRAQVEKAMLGEITPKQAIDAAQKEVSDEWAKYKQQNPPKK